MLGHRTGWASGLAYCTAFFGDFGCRDIFHKGKLRLAALINNCFSNGIGRRRIVKSFRNLLCCWGLGIFDFGVYFSRYFIGNSWLARLVKNCLSDWSTCAAWGGEDTVDSLSCERAPALGELVTYSSSELCLDSDLHSNIRTFHDSSLYCFNGGNAATDNAAD